MNGEAVVIDEDEDRGNECGRTMIAQFAIHVKIDFTSRLTSRLSVALLTQQINESVTH